jgi:outer membrane immunogenic protein
MKMLRGVFLNFIAIGALALAVTASDARGDGRDYRSMSPYSWSGFYVGAHLGGAWSDIKWTFLDPAGAFAITHEDAGFIGGGHAGYQMQWGHWVAGLEVSYSGTGLRDTFRDPDTGGSIRSQIEDLFLATARLGWAWDHSLAYVKGGYASAKAELNSFDAAGASLSESSKRQHGWTVGLGWEYALTRNAIFGLEYNYVDLDNHQFVHPPKNGGPPPPPVTAEGDTEIHTVMARLSFKFGREPEHVPLK